jgi:hypothetical protein
MMTHSDVMWIVRRTVDLRIEAWFFERQTLGFRGSPASGPPPAVVTTRLQ